MRNTTSTRTARTARAPRATVVATVEHHDIAPETEVIMGAEVLAGTDAGEVAEALAEIAAEEARTVGVTHNPATGMIVAPTTTSTPAKKARKATVKAVKETPAPTTHKKATSRELAIQALDAWNASNGTTYVFANHVLGNLSDGGAATFAVLDGSTKLRMDVHTVAGGGAEVVSIYAIPAKTAKDSATPVAE